MSDIELNTKIADSLCKALEHNKSFVKLGILNQKNTRKEGNGNADIGKKHEFGEFDPHIKKKLPVRSFLRMPMTMEFPKKIAQAGNKLQKAFKESILAGNMTPLLQKLAVLGQATIIEAFQTGGFGRWKKSNMKLKTNHQTLVETTQLRESIDWEIDTK